MRARRRKRTTTLEWVALCCLVWPCGACRDNPSRREATTDPSDDTGHQPGDHSIGVNPLEALAPLPMGGSDLRDYAYSMGPGRKPFMRALALEKRDESHKDWDAIASHCRTALAADPGHLEAHWHLALALSRVGQYDEVAEHLSAAAAGDWMRWGERSLSLKLLRRFYDTSPGQAYRDLVAGYREKFRRIAATGVLVVGRRGRAWPPGDSGDGSLNHRAELYAYDRDSRRYLRLSRTNGSLVGFVMLPGGTELVYASYRAVWTPSAAKPDREPYIRRLKVGAIDVENASMSRHEISLDGVAELWMGYERKSSTAKDTADPGHTPRILARVRSPTERDDASAYTATVRDYELDIEHGEATLVSARPTRPATGEPLEPLAGEFLHVAYDRVERLRIPIDGVMADWDETGAAGSFRLERTRKTVTLPGGALAHGHTMSWSPSRGRLAFADIADGGCEREAITGNTSLYVVEAATGAVRKLASSPGLQAPNWVDDTHVVFADTAQKDGVVRVIDVNTGELTVTLEAQGGVGTLHVPSRPFHHRQCTE